MKKYYKKIFVIIIFYNFQGLCADEVVDQIYRVRSQSFSAKFVSEDILNKVNSSEYLNLRTGLSSETGKGTGRLINESWISKAKTYMSLVNNRAHMDLAGAKDALANEKKSVSVLDKPVVPDEEKFKSELKDLDAQKNSKTKAVTKDFIRNNQKKLDSLINSNFADNKAKFSEKGISDLFNDITDLADGGFSNPKISRSVMAKFAANSDILAAMDIDGIGSIAKYSETSITNRVNIIDNIDNEKRIKSISFKKLQDEYPQKISTYEEKITNPEVSSPSKTIQKQTQLDNVFFKKNNLDVVHSLSDLTKDERIVLLRHSDNPLKGTDPKAALKIINDERNRQRKFVEQIRDVSNDVSNAVIEGRGTRVIGAFKSEAEKLTKIAKDKKIDARYRDIVNGKLHSNSLNKGISTLGVTDAKSRLVLLDAMSGGSIVPTNFYTYRPGMKTINVKEVLDNLKTGKDVPARKAFARYILDNGTSEQRRSLKIHGYSTVAQIESEEKYKARCRRGGTR